MTEVWVQELASKGVHGVELVGKKKEPPST